MYFALRESKRLTNGIPFLFPVSLQEDQYIICQLHSAFWHSLTEWEDNKLIKTINGLVKEEYSRQQSEHGCDCSSFVLKAKVSAKSNWKMGTERMNSQQEDT